jgi:hypothetical protein
MEYYLVNPKGGCETTYYYSDIGAVDVRE